MWSWLHIENPEASSFRHGVGLLQCPWSWCLTFHGKEAESKFWSLYRHPEWQIEALQVQISSSKTMHIVTRHEESSNGWQIMISSCWIGQVTHRISIRSKIYGQSSRQEYKSAHTKGFLNWKQLCRVFGVLKSHQRFAVNGSLPC